MPFFSQWFQTSSGASHAASAWRTRTGLVTSVTAQVKAPVLLAQTPVSATLLYVNPASGTDAPGAGSEVSPYRTIAYALRQATPGTYVQLARGSYTEASGEVFPLTVPPGVTLRGEESEKGQTVAIIGGGNLVSPTFARQNVTLQVSKDTEIRGVSFTNPNTRGTGIWIESVNSRIKTARLTATIGKAFLSLAQPIR
jgi:hypothetical protein